MILHATHSQELYLEMLHALRPRYGALEAGSLAKWLLEDIFECSFAHILSNFEVAKAYPIFDIDLLQTQVQRLVEGEPIQYVLGYAYFLDLKIACQKGVLIPRPETEELVYKVLQNRKVLPQKSTLSSEKVIDICSGSGCIALSLKHQIPHAEVWACDISPEAAFFTIQNARALQLPIHFFEADVLRSDIFPNHGLYDLIISNPPYVLPSEKKEMTSHVLEHEPHLALFVPEDDPLVFYRHIARIAIQQLKSQGTLALEIHRDMGRDMVKLLSDNGFSSIQVVQDFKNNDRFVFALKE